MFCFIHSSTWSICNENKVTVYAFETAILIYEATKFNDQKKLQLDHSVYLK
jgi:hypothetical protein